MSLASNDRKISYIGNDTTTTFSYDFKILSASHLRVVAVDSLGAETVLTLNTDYTVSGVGGGSGGTITLVDANQAWLDSVGNGLKTGFSLFIFGNTPVNQETDIRNQGPYYPSLHEDALDKNAMILQELSEKIRRAILFPSSTSFLDKLFPTPTLNNILIWDGSGNLINLPLSSIASGTYTGAALSLPLQSHTTGALAIPSNATYSSVFVSGASAKTITLPTAASAGAGRVFLIMSDSNASVTTVNRSGSDTIEGQTSLSFAHAYKWVYFVSDGVNMWHHNLPKALEITGAMIGQFQVGGDKWVHTLGGVQTSTFTASVNVGYQPCNSTSATITANLPSAATCQGKVFTFKNIGTANTVIIDPNASQLINGLTTFTLFPGECVTIVSDSANWQIIDFVPRHLISATSSEMTPTASGNFNQMTGNSLVIPAAGRWRLYGMARFGFNAASPAYTEVGVGWAAANGANSGTLPTVLTSGTNITVEGSFKNDTGFQILHKTSSTDTQFITFANTIIRTSGSATVFGNTYQLCSTPANSRIITHLNAERIGD